LEGERKKGLYHADAVLNIISTPWQQAGIGKYAKLKGLLTYLSLLLKFLLSLLDKSAISFVSLWRVKVVLQVLNMVPM